MLYLTPWHPSLGPAMAWARLRSQDATLLLLESVRPCLRRFRGTNDNTVLVPSRHRFNGVWIDGTPVRELRVRSGPLSP